MYEKLNNQYNVNILLYILCVLIWGSTWININYQLDVDVALEASIVYRFGIAAMMFFALCLIRKQNLSYTFKQHLQLAIFGFCLFCFNYFLLYQAQQYINSALACIVFSTLVFMNMLNAKWWFDTAITAQVYIGGSLGIIGITCMFWSEVEHLSLSDEVVVGLLLCLIGTLSASFGNMFSIRNNQQAIAMMPANAWGMTYGASFMFLLLIIQGKSFSFSWTVPYISSLLYLSIFGSVIGFSCYLTLMNRIGASKASYANIMYPAVAVVLSTLFESFEWRALTVVGFLLMMTGNWVALTNTLTNTRLKKAKVG